jgi:hypothetical protein
MSLVVDYAWGRPSVSALRALGTVAVCRYLAFPGPSTQGKLLSAAEVATLGAAGVAVVSNWEHAGSWTEYSGGFATGLRHATEAARQHTACGGPPDRPIYFSVDFDATNTQLPTVADYYRGVASVVGLGRTGAYGGYRTIRYLLDHGLVRWAWQTYAWSGGQWDGRAQLRQVRNGVPIDGVDCDLNESMTADFGQWGSGDDGMIDYGQQVPEGPARAGNPGRTIGQLLGDVWTQTFGVPDLVRAVGAKVDALGASGAPPQVVLTDADRADIAAKLAALVPTAAEIAKAVLDEQHRRDAA